MNKTEYLKKFNLINEYYKRNGYIISEAGVPDPTMDMGNNPMDNENPMGGQNQGLPQEDENGMNDLMGDNNSMGGQDQGLPQGGENMDMGMDQGMSQGAEGFDPQGQIEKDPSMSQAPIDSTETEEVIDVDDLTDSQEDTEKKVDLLMDKFDKLFKMIGSFEEKINQSDDNINSLKQEIEKRNPTNIEKMSMRSKGGYPFNVSPDEYWDDKEKTSNYSTEDDMNGENQAQYRITKNDVDNITDWASISKSLDEDGMFKNLKDIFEF